MGSVTFFCTASHFVPGAARPRPGAGELVHAKTMGTPLTVCGLNASTWMKRWECRFPAFAPTSCPACREVVAQFAPTATSRL